MTLRADLDHIALECQDRDKVLAFYTDVLNFESMQLAEAPFPSVRVSDVTILDFFQSDEPKGLRSANHVCFSVTKDAMEALRERLAKAGIQVDKPRLLGGAKGRGWSVYVHDPENNKLEFRYYD